MDQAELLVVGSLAYDDIETPLARGDKLLGGSATHFCAAAALVGVTPGLVAVVGEDFAEEDLNWLAQLPVDVSGVHRVAGETFRWGGRYSADFSERETLYTRLGVFEDFRPRLAGAHRQSKVIFLANIHPALQMKVLTESESASFVALDTMNLWIEQTRESLLDIIERIQLLFINDEEARLLTGETNLLRAGKALLDLGPEYCLLKKGEHGVVLFAEAGIFPCPAFPVNDVVDPTGAGDAFAGGVMSHLVREGRFDLDSLRRALLTGSVAGSFAVEGLGVEGLRRRSNSELTDRIHCMIEMLTPPPEESI